jgi:hypothetical protein
MGDADVIEAQILDRRAIASYQMVSTASGWHAEVHGDSLPVRRLGSAGPACRAVDPLFGEHGRHPAAEFRLASTSRLAFSMRVFATQSVWAW